MTSLERLDRLARASCFTCRRTKRRCDKSLPACQLCGRKGLRCTYPERRGQSPPSLPDSSRGYGSTTASAHAGPDLDNGATKLQSGQALRTPSWFATTAAIRFLAPGVFRQGSLHIPRLDLDIPDDVARQLGDSQQARDTTTEFFRRTRSWMPIVDRKRHLVSVLNPLSPCQRQTALLALCMKLFCLEAVDNEGAERTSLYQLTKRFYSEVESTEGLSVQVLQAAVCIAVFEIGDAIYPAAYLTVGACARYGIAMGLDKVNQDRMGVDISAASWMETEETRRVWWTVLILDRYVPLLRDPLHHLLRYTKLRCCIY